MEIRIEKPSTPMNFATAKERPEENASRSSVSRDTSLAAAHKHKIAMRNPTYARTSKPQNKGGRTTHPIPTQRAVGSFQIRNPTSIQENRIDAESSALTIAALSGRVIDVRKSDQNNTEIPANRIRCPITSRCRRVNDILFMRFRGHERPCSARAHQTLRRTQSPLFSDH